MTTVTEEAIQQSTEEINNLEEAGLQAMLKQMHEEQPNLLGYLFSFGENDLNDKEHEVLMYLGVNTWNAYKKVESLPLITEETINKVHETNEKSLEDLEQASDEAFTQEAMGMIENTPQPYLMQYMTILIMEDEEGVISQDAQGVMFLIMKSFIDAIEAGRADSGESSD